METREILLYFVFLIIAFSASISLVITLTYIPLKKLPSVLKTSANALFQKFYMSLVFSLFVSLIGLSLYLTVSYKFLQVYNLNEIVRVGILVAYIVSLFFVTLSFKKQTLSPLRIAVQSFLVSGVLVIATQENTLDYYRYPYTLIILIVCIAIRHGVSVFTKKL